MLKFNIKEHKLKELEKYGFKVHKSDKKFGYIISRWFRYYYDYGDDYGNDIGGIQFDIGIGIRQDYSLDISQYYLLKQLAEEIVSKLIKDGLIIKE